MANRAPHLAASPAITIRRGSFWIPGDIVVSAAGTVQRAPMFVQWEAPDRAVHPTPLVLVHGGGGQGADWTTTPDGRPGWADRLREAGFAVYVVDRVGHGRSPAHPDIVGPPGAAMTYEAAQRIFAPGDSPQHTQWPWPRAAATPQLDSLVAGSGHLLADAPMAQETDAARLASLIDRIGPVILVTHSAGAPSGWLAAAARPGAVRAIVAVEPQGPPFSARSSSLDWGVTAAPMPFEPPVDSADDLTRPLTGRTVSGLRIPVAIVTGAASVHFLDSAPKMAAFLRDVGSEVDLIDLGSLGISGNGHGLIFEANSNETVVPVIDWIRRLP